MKIPDNVWERAVATAKKRHEIHKEHKTHRPLTSQYQDSFAEYEYELRGILGEWAGCTALRVPMDWELRPEGDGRKDTRIAGFTIDFKTMRRWHHLLFREARKKHADILVAVELSLKGRYANVIGWEFDKEMLKCPTKQFHPRGPKNYYKHRRNLRPLGDLLKLLAEKKV